ncbi:MAG: hypothetical protein ACLFRG_09055 [Desulfococcaceae bacterium]
MGAKDAADPGRQFLEALFAATDGDPEIQVSMYEIGESAGMDREQSEQVAQELMTEDLAAFKTLSGGIGITAAGVEVVRPERVHGKKAVRLGDQPCLDSAGRAAVADIVDRIKPEAGRMGLPYEALDQLIADLRSLDCQMVAPGARTPIVRACLEAVAANLSKQGEMEWSREIRELLAD